MPLTHLLLMRHAKSSHDDPRLEDHARPLNARGERDAVRVAQELAARGYAPDTLWASSAVRTQSTAKLLMRTLPGPQTVLSLPDFYNATADGILHVMAEMDEPDGKLMILGHNPGMQTLATLLGGTVRNMPTAAVCIFQRVQGRDRWSPSAWRAIESFTPKHLH